ncbi:MAG: DUF5777 family beta-barrel protein [Bacteroidales bacterium]|nr:DUF5777 family beta-barrel protein [Bacteroidales bacterium]MCF8332505.1 DUF5777 family beta-barrel protein [Bacteroidales bacterium]
MTYIRKTLFLPLILVFASSTFAQDDLMGMLDDNEPETTYADAIFKSTRVIQGHSVKSPSYGVLQFVVSHHFGRINQGISDFFGLDQATIRLDLHYGLTDRLAVGIGRSSFQKTLDGYIKYRMLRQSSGKKTMPVTVSYLAATDVNTLKWQEPDRNNHFSSHVSYVHQLLIARKFNDQLSLQLTPSLVHKNLVEDNNDNNDIFATGFSGRYMITGSLSINAEYFHVFGERNDPQYENALAIGVDLETGGHVFQLHLTNSQPMFERGFITETRGKWGNGDIYFGFNINRVFTIQEPKEFKE